MTLIKSKINPLAWLKSAIYVSVVGGIILSPKSASAAVFHTPLIESETRGTFGLTSLGSFGDSEEPLRYELSGTYWTGVVNVEEDSGPINDVLRINGHFQHIKIPSHREDDPTGSLFSFIFEIAADNPPTEIDPTDGYVFRVVDQSYAHSEHSDAFKALLKIAAPQAIVSDRITSWVFTLEGNHKPEPVPPPEQGVPEPLTMLGAAAAIGYGAILKQKSSKMKKS